MNNPFSSLTKYFSGENNFHPDSSPNSGLEIAIADGPNIPQEKHSDNGSNLLRGIKGYVAKVGLTVALTGYLLAGSACGSQAPPIPTQDPNLQATVEALQNENTNLRRELIESKSTQAPTLESTLIATPIPEKNRIYGIDVHHGSRGMISDYVKEKGWKTIELNVEPLTSEYLQQQGVTILSIRAVKLPYTEREIAEIVRFVEQGGGLLLQADNPMCREWSKEVARKFGVIVTDKYLDYDRFLTVTSSSNHQLMQDVNSFSLVGDDDYCHFSGQPSYLEVNTPAYPVLEGGITGPYLPLIVAVEHGKGRVVVYPSSFDITLARADNSNFLRNALFWLQQEKLP